VPLRSRRPDVSGELEAVVMRCLEKDAGRRFQSVGELAMGLKPFAAADSKGAVDRIARIGGAKSVQSVQSPQAAQSAPASSPSSPHVATGFAETVATWQTASGQRRNRTRNYVLVGVVAAVFVFLGGGLIRAKIQAHRPPVVVQVPQPVLVSAPPPPALTVPPLPSTVFSAAGAASQAASLPSSSAAAPTKPRAGSPGPASKPSTPKPQSTDALMQDRY
jgi:hypothetical protein